MNHKELFGALKRGDIARCYLFEGEEEYIKAAALKALRAQVAGGDFAVMNDTRLVDPAPDALVAAAETMPFIADRRFLEIRDCAMLQGEKSKNYDEKSAVERLDEYLERLPDTVCMVFYVRGKADARKKLYDILKKKAVIVSFEELKEQELSQWIAQTLAKRGKKISVAACQQLWFTAGKDLTLLDNEIEKLAAYTGDREEITQEDVEAISVRSVSYKLYHLTDALLSGQCSQAMELMAEMLREGERRLAILPKLGELCRQLKYIKAMTAGGVSSGEIAKRLGIHPFVAQKNTRLARKYSLAQLNDMARWCLEAEYQVKSGKIAEEGSLEKVMLEILSVGEKQDD